MSLTCYPGVRGVAASPHSDFGSTHHHYFEAVRRPTAAQCDTVVWHQKS